MALFGGILGGDKDKNKKKVGMPKVEKPSMPRPEKRPAPAASSDDEEEDIDLSSFLGKKAKPASTAPAGNDSTVMIKPGAAKTAPMDQPLPLGRASTSSRRKRSSVAKKRMGNLLLNAQVITEEELQEALATQKRRGGLIGQILVEMGACTEANVGAALGSQRTITTVELGTVNFTPEAAAAIPREICEKFRMIPFQKIGTLLCVAMSNVLDSTAKAELKDRTGLKLKTFDASWADIQQAIEKHCTYGADTADAAPAAAKEETSAAADMEIELPDEEPASNDLALQPEEEVLSAEVVEEKPSEDEEGKWLNDRSSGAQ